LRVAHPQPRSAHLHPLGNREHHGKADIDDGPGKRGKDKAKGDDKNQHD
jgi:hypothetical protein